MQMSSYERYEQICREFERERWELRETIEGLRERLRDAQTELGIRSARLEILENTAKIMVEHTLRRRRSDNG